MTGRIAGWLVVLGLMLAVVAWSNAGVSFVVLGSPSMEPYASPGDLLIHRDVPADDVAVGDVVTVPVEGDTLATHRVVRLAPSPTGISARLKGDASPLPDLEPVLLRGEVARVVVVVPLVGSVLTAGAPLLWGGLGLLVLGGVLVVVRREEPEPAPLDPRREAQPDPRLEALLATCEQFAEDDMPAVVLRDLVRVRTAALLGLPSAERAGAVLALDDGARFYIIGLADADPDALALIPPGSERRVQASIALEQWWLVVGRDVPPAVAERIAPWVQEQE